MEGMMRYHFCTAECHALWEEDRHDEGVLKWLRRGKEERAKVLEQARDEARTHTTAHGDTADGLRDLPCVELPMWTYLELSQATVLPVRPGCDSDRRVRPTELIVHKASTFRDSYI